MTSRRCIVCERETDEAALEEASVRSNVRAFRGERFVLWRCAHCKSLHARDDVNLAHYYARYPFHDLPVDWRLRVMYDNLRSRLERAGLERNHRVLDYGCGGGNFVRYLRATGYENVSGFDEYGEEFGNRSVLDREYDCILSQDVIEHVPSPNALLVDFHRLVRKRGIVAVGTPNATAIDLRDPEAFVHTLHAPYHRHILSKQALVDAGTRHGLTLAKYYSTMYSNTRFPFLNEAFYLYYTRIADDTLDALTEPVRVGALLLRAPATFFWGFFGYFFSRNTDVMAVFRRA